MITLKENERLVYAGDTALRAPGGTLLPAVPQFMIVPVDKVGPGAHIATLGKDEQLVLAGHVLSDRKRAEERFAALQAGRKPPPQEEGTPLYVVLDNEGAALNAQEQKAVNADITKDIAALFSLHMRRLEMENRQRKASEATP